MKKQSYLFPALLLALVACSQPVTFPQIEGTWSDSTTAVVACGAADVPVTLNLSQSGAEVTGDLLVDDIYGTDNDGTGPFTGTVDQEGNLTGEVLMTSDDGSPPDVNFSVEGSLNDDETELDTTFTSTHTIDCSGTPTTVTMQGVLTR